MTNINETAVERASIMPDSPMWGEHRSRYLFASGNVKDKIVLDIACGTGFGVEILSSAGAKSVYAIDYSMEALQITKKIAKNDCLVLRADGKRLCFEDESLDVITSFETIEHIQDFEAFCSELARVLNNAGILIISTPNALYTKPVNGIPKNPFHFREFTPNEFKEILGTYFTKVDLVGQRVSMEHRLCPYWELPEMLPTDMKSRTLILLKKLLGRLPHKLREAISMKLTNRSYNPGENDFIFSSDELESGYVQVAICKK